ncbi:MAG TPA: hypothetical protein VII40_03625 [Xanthobacteraceae bacterium]|jgi:hypothetical protein
MPIDVPPAPPRFEQDGVSERHEKAPIVDKRGEFARKTPQTADDATRAREFIDGKIEMIRRDPNMSQAEKDKAIRELESKR